MLARYALSSSTHQSRCRPASRQRRFAVSQASRLLATKCQPKCELMTMIAMPIRCSPVAQAEQWQ